MNPSAKQTIHNFLATNNLNPQERPPAEGADNWLFDIAENLQSELFCYEVEDNAIIGLVVTSIKIPESNEVTMLAAAMNPALAPATILHVGEVLSLRLMVSGSAEAMPGLLEESIVISRHVINAVFPRMLELAENKLPMQNAMVLAMQALQGEENK